MIHVSKVTKPHRTRVTGKLHCVTCPPSGLSPHQLAQYLNFPPFSKVPLRKSKTKMSLLPKDTSVPSYFIPSHSLSPP